MDLQLKPDKQDAKPKDYRKKMFECDICGHTAYSAQKLGLSYRLKHIKAVHPELLEIKTYSCDICQLPFDQPSHLSKHMKTHELKILYKCTVKLCKKSFNDQALLDLHKLSHASKIIKNFECEICNEEFFCEIRFDNHIKLPHIHLCKACDKSFAKLSNFKTHINQVHNMKWNSSDPTKRCNYEEGIYEYIGVSMDTDEANNGDEATSKKDKVASNNKDKVATSNRFKVATSNKDKVAASNKDKVATSNKGKVDTSNTDNVATNNKDKVGTSTKEKVAKRIKDKVASSKTDKDVVNDTNTTNDATMIIDDVRQEFEEDDHEEDPMNNDCETSLYTTTRKTRDKYVYQCNQCKQSFTRKNKLKVHLKSHSSNLKPNDVDVCEICDLEFRMKFRYQRHLRMSHCHLCKACGKRFTTMVNFKAHINQVHDIRWRNTDSVSERALYNVYEYSADFEKADATEAKEAYATIYTDSDMIDIKEEIIDDGENVDLSEVMSEVMEQHMFNG